MARGYTVENIYDKKHKTFAFDGIFFKAMGTPETGGCWIISGAEKNGKTWVSIKLAEYLSTFTKVRYISAEEGISQGIQDAFRRAKIEKGNKNLIFDEYVSIEELYTMLNNRKFANVIFIDNVTVYADELKGGAVRNLLRKFPDKLFVFIAHEEKGEIYTATAKLCRKLAKVIIRVAGLSAYISGRCPGGVISIDEEKAALYWGESISNN